MGLQETFTQVYTHLIKQGVKSVKTFPDDWNGCEYEGCAYRGVGGLACAAGCLISDEDYVEAMEGKRVYAGIVTPTLEKNGHDIDLVSRLQTIHDDNEPAAWPGLLGDLAVRYNLEVPTVA